MGMIWLRMLVATGIASLSASALASGALEVSLRYPADAEGLRIDRGKGVIEVVLANKGPEPIDVSERSIPKPNSKGVLFNDFFDIRTDTGARVSYLGILVSYANVEGSYLRLRPGAEFVLTVDLTTNYRLEPGGSYEVQLRPVRYLPRARDHYALYSFYEVHRLMQGAEPARTLFLRVGDNARMQRQALEVEPAEECGDWQMEKFGEARTAAKSQAAEAFARYHGLFEGRVTPGGLVVEFNAPARYTRWFGEDPPGAYWEWSEDDSVLFATLLALPARLETPGFTLSCDCSADGIPSGTLAYVYRHIHYVVHACPNFWEAPLFPEFKDQSSRVGTLVHEASHFEDEMMPTGTLDHAQLYDSVLDLAKGNRSEAVLNANSYKFFVLDLNC